MQRQQNSSTLCRLLEYSFTRHTKKLLRESLTQLILNCLFWNLEKDESAILYYCHLNTLLIHSLYTNSLHCTYLLLNTWNNIPSLSCEQQYWMWLNNKERMVLLILILSCKLCLWWQDARLYLCKFTIDLSF